LVALADGQTPHRFSANVFLMLYFPKPNHRWQRLALLGADKKGGSPVNKSGVVSSMGAAGG